MRSVELKEFERRLFIILFGLGTLGIEACLRGRRGFISIVLRLQGWGGRTFGAVKSHWLGIKTGNRISFHKSFDEFIITSSATSLIRRTSLIRSESCL